MVVILVIGNNTSINCCVKWSRRVINRYCFTFYSIFPAAHRDHQHENNEINEEKEKNIVLADLHRFIQSIQTMTTISDEHSLAKKMLEKRCLLSMYYGTFDDIDIG